MAHLEQMRSLSDLRAPEINLRAKKYWLKIFDQICLLKIMDYMNYMTLTYRFADEIIENNQDRKWEKAVDDEIWVDEVIFHIIRVQSQVCWVYPPDSLIVLIFIFHDIF